MEESRHGGQLGSICCSNHMVRDATRRKQSFINRYVVCSHQKSNIASCTNKLAESAFRLT
jgi:hypothetical protein